MLSVDPKDITNPNLMVYYTHCFKAEITTNTPSHKTQFDIDAPGNHDTLRAQPTDKSVFYQKMTELICRSR